LPEFTEEERKKRWWQFWRAKWSGYEYIPSADGRIFFRGNHSFRS
jgi:hypothetical protein